MNKIEAIAVITDKGDGYGKYIEWNDSILRHGLPSQTCLYTESALQVVAEVVRSKIVDCYQGHVSHRLEVEREIMAIDLAAIINQLKGQ